MPSPCWSIIAYGNNRLSGEIRKGFAEEKSGLGQFSEGKKSRTIVNGEWVIPLTCLIEQICQVYG
jgi:hypothetical protein